MLTVTAVYGFYSIVRCGFATNQVLSSLQGFKEGLLSSADTMTREQPFRVHVVTGPNITRTTTATYLIRRGKERHLLVVFHVCFNTSTVSSTGVTRSETQ